SKESALEFTCWNVRAGNPEQCDDYLQWHWVENKRLLNWAQKYKPQLFDSISADSKQLIQQKFEEVRLRFEYATRDKKKKLRDGWCDLSLADRTLRTGFEENYRLVMPNANQILHGAIGGMRTHFDLEQDTHRIAVHLSDDWAGEVLMAGHVGALRAIDTL